MDNTSKDAMLARKAGMSYGQWKALHPYTKEEAKPIPSKKESVCQYCGKTFYPKTNRPQKYCQFYCQNTAAQLRLRERKESVNEQG